MRRASSSTSRVTPAIRSNRCGSSTGPGAEKRSSGPEGASPGDAPGGDGPGAGSDGAAPGREPWSGDVGSFIATAYPRGPGRTGFLATTSGSGGTGPADDAIEVT